jgi:hypothetical protein
MFKVKCNVCQAENDLPENTKDGDRFTCHNCFAQLAFSIKDGKPLARCAVCLMGRIECGSDCERRLTEKEKLGFFNIKLK